MGLSTKNLFLGVYASNGGIRVLFVPLCYLFSASPFALLLLRYLGTDQKILQSIPEEYKSLEVWIEVLAALVAVSLATRVITGWSNEPVNNGGKRRIQPLPYWIPGARHWANVVLWGESWLKGVRESSITNVIAYSAAGAKHNVIISPALLDRVLGNSNALDEADLTKIIALRNVFGLPSNAEKQYLQLRPAILEKFESEIFKGKQLKKTVVGALDILSHSLPDLITFNSSIVDQLPWERVAGVELTKGTDEVECDLFALVNEYFCSVILPPIVGAQFYESYQLLASDLSTLNQSFYALAVGFPRFFPLPGLPGASLAKKRLLQNFTKLFSDLTNPPAKREINDDESLSGEEETDAEIPTVITALNELFSQHDMPIPARAAITLEVVHKVIAQAIPLAFWTLFHIYASSASPLGKEKEHKIGQTPLYQIREETKSWAEAIQPPAVHPSFPCPPEISFTSPTALFAPSKFTYLRSAIFEARRLYSAPITTAQVTKPITVTETLSARPGEQEMWAFDVGSYLDIGLSQTLANTSPADYLSPELYKPDRFANVQSPAPLSSSIYNEPEELTTVLLVAFVAGITQLWDISAAPKKSLFVQMQEAQAAAVGQTPNTSDEENKVGIWTTPKAVDGSSVKLPKGEVKVRFRRREGLDGPKTMRKGR